MSISQEERKAVEQATHTCSDRIELVQFLHSVAKSLHVSHARHPPKQRAHETLSAALG